MPVGFVDVSLAVLEHLKVQNGYTEECKNCASCVSFIEESFSSSASCGRNPDIFFPVKPFGCCAKWKSDKEVTS